MTAQIKLMKQWQLTEKFYVTLEQKRQHYITKESEFLRMKRCKLSVRDFIPLKVIGKGAFGEVRMCVHRESNAQRAVKVLRKSNMDEDEKRMLFNEINILKEIVCSFGIHINKMS